MATSRQFDLAQIRHPFTGTEIWPISLEYSDGERVVKSTYGRLLPTLVKSKPQPVTSGSIKDLVRSLTEEINYALNRDQSHIFLSINDISEYVPNDLKNLQQLIFSIVITGKDILQLDTTDSKEDFNDILVRILIKDNYLYKSDYILLKQLIITMHYFNLMYPKESNKEKLDVIKIAIINQLKNKIVLPEMFIRRLGVAFFETFMGRG